MVPKLHATRIVDRRHVEAISKCDGLFACRNELLEEQCLVQVGHFGGIVRAQAEVHLVGAGRDAYKAELGALINVVEWGVVDRDGPVMLQQQARLTIDSGKSSGSVWIAGAYLDGETDVELHSMYERLMSETRAVGAAVGGR